MTAIAEDWNRHTERPEIFLLTKILLLQHAPRKRPIGVRTLSKEAHDTVIEVDPGVDVHRGRLQGRTDSEIELAPLPTLSDALRRSHRAGSW